MIGQDSKKGPRQHHLVLPNKQKAKIPQHDLENLLLKKIKDCEIDKELVSNIKEFEIGYNDSCAQCLVNYGNYYAKYLFGIDNSKTRIKFVEYSCKPEDFEKWKKEKGRGLDSNSYPDKIES